MSTTKMENVPNEVAGEQEKETHTENANKSFYLIFLFLCRKVVY